MYLHTWNMDNWKSDRVSSVCPFFWNVIQKYLHPIPCSRHSTFAVCCIPNNGCRCFSDENKWEFHSGISITMVAISSISPIDLKWNEIAESIMNELYYPAADFLYLNWNICRNWILNWMNWIMKQVHCFFICPRLKYVFGPYESLNSTCYAPCSPLTSAISHKLWNKCLWTRRIHSFCICHYPIDGIDHECLLLFRHLNQPKHVILDVHIVHEPKMVFCDPVQIVFQLTFIATHICHIYENGFAHK